MPFVQDIREAYEEARDNVIRHKDRYVTKKGAFTRLRKMGLKALIDYLVTRGSKSGGNAIEEYFEEQEDCPTESAVLQQRKKLMAEALLDLLRQFAQALMVLFAAVGALQIVATDGTDVPFNNPGVRHKDWQRTWNGVKAGCAHVTAIYDLATKIFLDAVIQAAHFADERGALVEMIDRFITPWKLIPVLFTADRGFPSWNMAVHVMQKGHFFLIRTLDVTSQGSQLRTLFPAVPSGGCFDLYVKVRIVRSKRKATGFDPKTGCISVYLDKSQRFDFIPAGSEDSHEFTIRVCRFRLDNGTYECLMTNLTKTKYPTHKLRKLYYKRWGIEVAWGRCKSPLAMEAFNTRNPALVMQDILGTLIEYNFVRAVCIISGQVLTERNSDSGNKYAQEPDFSHAVRPCVRFLLHRSYPDGTGLIERILRHCHCVRPNRTAPRGRIRKHGPVPFVGRAS